MGIVQHTDMRRYTFEGMEDLESLLHGDLAIVHPRRKHIINFEREYKIKSCNGGSHGKFALSILASV